MVKLVLSLDFSRYPIVCILGGLSYISKQCVSQ